MGPIGDCPLWVLVRIKRGGVHSTVPDIQKINSSRVLVLVPFVLLLLEACVLSCFSCVQFFVTLWTIDRQASLFMGLSRQEYWHGLPCPTPGKLPNPEAGVVMKYFIAGNADSLRAPYFPCALCMDCPPLSNQISSGLSSHVTYPGVSPESPSRWRCVFPQARSLPLSKQF